MTLCASRVPPTDLVLKGRSRWSTLLGLRWSNPGDSDLIVPQIAQFSAASKGVSGAVLQGLQWLQWLRGQGREGASSEAEIHGGGVLCIGTMDGIAIPRNTNPSRPGPGREGPSALHEFECWEKRVMGEIRRGMEKFASRAT